MQMRIAQRKGYSSRDVFKVGDRVRIKNNVDGRWETKGVIKEARSSGTSSAPASFLILCDSGTEMLRHKSYIKHDYTDLDQQFEGLASSLSASGGTQAVADQPVLDPILPVHGSDSTAADNTPVRRDTDPVEGSWESRLRPRARTESKE